MTRTHPLGSFVFVFLAAIAVTGISFGQGASVPKQSSPKSGTAVPVTMTECEGVNNCATWTFLGGQGNGQWPTGEIANLSVERSDANSVVIRRADSTGASAGLTAVYTGTRHEDRVGGEFTSSWPGHWENKSGNWYGTVEKDPQTLPNVMHFCAGNCQTLTWDHGHFVAGPRYPWESPNHTSIWTVERFTRQSVILRRHDSPDPGVPGWPGGNVLYAGHMSNDGNSLIFDTENGGVRNVEKLKLAWGAALDTVPGNNAERDRAQGSPQPMQPVIVVSPVVCVPWFFTVVCG
jgi:hypothetical protein